MYPGKKWSSQPLIFWACTNEIKFKHQHEHLWLKTGFKWFLLSLSLVCGVLLFIKVSVQYVCSQVWLKQSICSTDDLHSQNSNKLYIHLYFKTMKYRMKKKKVSMKYQAFHWTGRTRCMEGAHITVKLKTVRRESKSILNDNILSRSMNMLWWKMSPINIAGICSTMIMEEKNHTYTSPQL